MRALFAALALTALATPACAALAPQYYQEAREKAPNVVVFDVLGVATPRGEAGNCMVTGKVIRAERGTKYKPGDDLLIAVPCRSPRAPVRVGATVWQDMEALVRSAHGKAYLDDAGRLALDQYQLYDLH
jgi:hypothetical protein